MVQKVLKLLFDLISSWKTAHLIELCCLFQGSSKGDDGVYLFEPHSRPINCLSFAPDNCAKLFTCSYDGTLRCCDFNSATFQEVISIKH